MNKVPVQTLAATFVSAVVCGMALRSGIPPEFPFMTLAICVMLSTWMK